MSKTQYIYCLKPDKMIGTKLVPLSELGKLSKKLYIKEKSKYNDRHLKAKDIPILNCNWDDVVFFSCLNPEIIFLALELFGLFDNREIKYFKFPITSLKNKEICYYNENYDGKEAFKNVDFSSYKELKSLPYDTAKYFLDCIKENKDPLIFSSVPHILLKGNLDIFLGAEITYIPINFEK